MEKFHQSFLFNFSFVCPFYCLSVLKSVIKGVLRSPLDGVFHFRLNSFLLSAATDQIKSLRFEMKVEVTGVVRCQRCVLTAVQAGWKLKRENKYK